MEKQIQKNTRQLIDKVITPKRDQSKMPMPFGYGSSVVLSGSMEPALKKDDWVFIKKCPEYEPGDVVIYKRGERLIIHRIVSKEGTSYITKGDANQFEDAPVDLKDIKGKMIGMIPKAGKAVHFMQSPAGVILCGVLILSLLKSSDDKTSI